MPPLDVRTREENIVRAARTRGDRAYRRVHWLAAVLMLTGIAGVSVMVRQWPRPAVVQAPARPHVPASPPLLAARRLPMVDVAALPQRAAASATAAVAMPLPQTPPSTGDAAAPPGEVTMVDERAAASSASAVEAAPPLASRHLAVFASPRMPRPEPEVQIDPSAPAYTFVELPAVAVGRVVVVAGRGIKTGIRVTSAAFRAAF